LEIQREWGVMDGEGKRGRSRKEERGGGFLREVRDYPTLIRK